MIHALYSAKEGILIFKVLGTDRKTKKDSKPNGTKHHIICSEIHHECDSICKT